MCIVAQRRQACAVYFVCIAHFVVFYLLFCRKHWLENDTASLAKRKGLIIRKLKKTCQSIFMSRMSRSVHIQWHTSLTQQEILTPLLLKRFIRCDVLYRKGAVTNNIKGMWTELQRDSSLLWVERQMFTVCRGSQRWSGHISGPPQLRSCVVFLLGSRHLR